MRENAELKALVRLSQEQYRSKVKILRLAPNTELGWAITIPNIRLGRFTLLSTKVEQRFLIKQLPNNNNNDQSLWFVQKVFFIHDNGLNPVKNRLAFRTSFEEINCAIKTMAEATNLRPCNIYTNKDIS